MQKQFSFLPKLAALSVMAACAAPAMAQTAGSNIVNLGWFHLAPQDSSEILRKNDGPGAGPIPGSGSTVNSADTLGIAFTHFLTDNVSLTADLGIDHMAAAGGGRFVELNFEAECHGLYAVRAHFRGHAEKAKLRLGAGHVDRLGQHQWCAVGLGLPLHLDAMRAGLRG